MAGSREDSTLLPSCVATTEARTPILPREPAGLTYRFLPWTVAAVSLLAAAALAFFLKSPLTAKTTRSLISSPDKVTFAFAQPSGAPVLSPDGTRLVFPAADASDKESLWVRPLDSLTAQPLEGTQGAQFPFWAPDSRQVGFFQDGKLKKIDVTGGPPVLVCEAPDARGGTWGRDNVIVFAPQAYGGSLSSVPAAGGTPTPVADTKGPGANFSTRWPAFLPDGRHFLFLSGDLSAVGTSKLGIYVGELGSPGQQFLLQADSNAFYSPPGYLLFLRGDTLMAQGFDAGSRKLKGDTFPVAEHVASPRQFRLGLFSVSQSGLLVFEAGQVAGEGGQFVWLDADGKEIGKVGKPGVSQPRLAPDGKRLAYMGGSFVAMSGDIWIMDLARGVQTRLTFGPTVNMSPVWAPDGSRIAYSSFHNGQFDLFVKDSSGAGNPQTLFESERPKAPTDWSRDGRYIVFNHLGAKTQADIWVLPLFGDRKPFPYLQTKFSEDNAVFSPDGHWLAYLSDESGSNEVYISPFPGSGGKWQVSQGGGDSPEWNRDGSALYYAAPGGQMMEAAVKEEGSAVQIGTPRRLFQEPSMNPDPVANSFTVSPDGKRFLVDRTEQRVSPPVTLVTNWTSCLQK